MIAMPVCRGSPGEKGIGCKPCQHNAAYSPDRYSLFFTSGDVPMNAGLRATQSQIDEVQHERIVLSKYSLRERGSS